MESMREFSDRIADALAAGSVPWRSIAPDQGLPLRFDGRPWSGASVIALWMTAQHKGFERPTWLSRQRIDELDGDLKAGAVPATAFLRGRRPRRQDGPGGGLATVDVWRACDVWSVDEIDGLPDHLYRRAGEFRCGFLSPDPAVGPSGEDRFASFVETLDGWEGARALSSGTAARGVVHWTASPARMNRSAPAGAGDGGHSHEGLVAEIGAAVLLAEFGLATSSLGPEGGEPAAAWADTVVRMRADERAIFRAARDATDAVEWLRRQVPGYRRFTAQAFRPEPPGEVSVTRAGAQVIAAAGMTPGAVISQRLADELAPLLAAQRARRVTGEALGFRHRPVPAGDDGGAWRARAAALIKDLAGLDLASPRVRAAVEAEVAVAASREAEVVSAEAFVQGFREATQRRLAMADLTARHTEAMTIGGTSLGL